VPNCPQFSTCVFSPASVTPNANSSTTSTLTITTNVGGTSPTGTTSLTISGNSGAHTTSVSLTINAPPDFSMSASPSSLTIAQGSSNTSTITVTSLNGFNSVIPLASTCVAFATCVLNPTSVFPPGNGTATSVLTITTNVGGTTPTGTSTLTVSGNSGSRSTTVSLTVTASSDFSISASPSSATVTSGSSGGSTVTITSTGGYSKAVTLSVPNCPSGATCSFSANPVTPAANGSITSGLTISGAAAGGPYSVTISGTDGTLTHTTPFSLTVTLPSDFSISASPSSATVASEMSAGSTV